MLRKHTCVPGLNHLPTKNFHYLGEVVKNEILAQSRLKVICKRYDIARACLLALVALCLPLIGGVGVVQHATE